jgi:hypothetical protein
VLIKIQELEYINKDNQENTDIVVYMKKDFRILVHELDHGEWKQVGDDIGVEAAGDVSGNDGAVSSDGSRIAIGDKCNDGNGDASGHIRVFGFTSEMVGHKLVPTLTAKLLVMFRDMLFQCQVIALLLQLVPRKMIKMEVYLVISVFMASRLKMVGHKLVTTLTVKLLLMSRDGLLQCQVMAILKLLVPRTMMEMVVILATSVLMASRLKWLDTSWYRQ